LHAAIVGGGINGVAAAYYLRESGVAVTLFEKSHLGAGSTDRANGGIREQFSSPVSVALSQESKEVWERFDDEFDTDIELRRNGYMFLCRTPSLARRFRENVRLQRDMGVDSRFLTADEAGAVCPGLYEDEYVGAAYSPDDAIADPHLALQGFATAAADAGADIRTGTEVLDVCQSDGRATGVRTAEGVVEADYVVNAAGPWAARVGAMVGLDLPISPKRRTIAVARPETPIPESVPLTIDPALDIHFRPEKAGKIICGGHFADEDPDRDPDTYSERVSFEFRARALEAVARAVDYLGPETRVLGGWAGLYAVTPDHHPVIEETMPGFVNAVGFSGHGFMQSPATGQLVAEIVADGEPSLVDVSALTADRFERGESLHEGTVID
jgi:sarcosine oxidase subunit beta